MSLAVPQAAATELQSFLAFDFGQQRTGVAYASRMLGQAQPQGTVLGGGEARWVAIAKHISSGSPRPWWWVCLITLMVLRMKIP